MTRSATKARTVSTTHTVFVAAPPRAVYELIADVARWPFIFSSTVHAERLVGGATEERLRLWLFANGAVRNLTSRRVLDPDGLRIRFRHETPSPPVAVMSGEWVLVPLPGNATSVVLLHEFRAIDDDPTCTALIKQAVDRNSTSELAAIKRTAELAEQLPMLVHSFADTMVIDAAVGPVYDFLYRVQDWPRRLPHVAHVILDEAMPNVQSVEMGTGAVDGSMLTTRMVRVCSPYHSIVFKQIQPPDILSAHVGGWYLYPTASGVRVTAHNTVMIHPDRAAEVYGQNGRNGQNGTAGQVVDLIRQSLRQNCLATLTHAKHAAEAGGDLSELPAGPELPVARPGEADLPEMPPRSELPTERSAGRSAGRSTERQAGRPALNGAPAASGLPVE